MIEKVARAIYQKHGDNFGGFALSFDEINKVRRHAFLIEARAAIEAMREPTPRMIEEIYGLDGAWRDAIDAALSEDET